MVCDTGPLVAAALSGDPDHHACIELFTGMHLAERELVLPTPVVAEVGYLLGAKAGAIAESAFLWSLAAGDFRTICAHGRPRRPHANLPL